jgi:hypothetical protein
MNIPSSIKKIWSDYGVFSILGIIIILYVFYMFYNYNKNKSFGSELMTSTANSAYSNGGVPSPASEGNNETFMDVNQPQQQISTGCKNIDNMNPAELLPRDNNSEWAQLNPVGQGNLNNINMLKAGYHIGIDTIGQSMRNPNLQIRSEPPNPQISVGPWNQSTITPDLMRPPLEIGQGAV